MNYDSTNITEKINNVIDTVFIFAAGNGTRLKPFTNHIPKILVNIDNDNILTKIINYWNKYTNKFVIIINKNYENIIDFYMKQFNIQYEIKCINITNQENVYTIKNSVDEQYFGKNILFIWCDIYPI